MEPKWLVWAREIQAIAQTGLAYATDVYDRERYERLQELSAHMLADASGLEVQRIKDLFAHQQGYATPKVDVRAAIFRNGQVLLVQERRDGRWSLPGGWADVNQSPKECVVREVREEAGLEVEPREIAAVYDRARHPHVPAYAFHVYKMFFLCDIVGGEPRPGLETRAVAFFDRDRLPELSIGRVLDYQIRRMFAHAETPGLPAEFD